MPRRPGVFVEGLVHPVYNRTWVPDTCRGPLLRKGAGGGSQFTSPSSPRKPGRR